ncbi:MAG: glycoside hydrolase family 2 protein [Treponema sp.]|nr:glycoside hydrolase family 2 protein [Treponema sp.]
MRNIIPFNDGWDYSPNFSDEMIGSIAKDGFEQVRLPHTVCVTPFNNFSPELYQKNSLYKKVFVTDKSWEGKKIILSVGAAAHESTVFLNGKELYTHRCGYTAFDVDLSDALNPVGKENVLAIKVDSRESLDIPPFGNVIDYMTYGGIYREVSLKILSPIYIEDVFVTTKGNHFNSRVSLSSESVPQGFTLRQKIMPSVNAPVTGNPDQPCVEINTGASKKIVLTSANASGIALWTLETPALYMLTSELLDENGTVVDSVETRFGFRDIRFDESGFYLNEKKIKIRGLNRHQSWPYIGYAAPKNMQREDADILKYELGLNEVRTSHYPQSQHFVDRCDEIGLLVFTEIPGWQHIGGEAWKNQAVKNVEDMVRQYRNHPSVFIWGVRINESLDNDELYKKTNELAHILDSTRPTGGVRYLKNSSLLEDVYTFNDFSFYGVGKGVLHKKKVTNTRGGYMVTEYNGHMFPTKSFDCESHRTEHALRHATVLDTVAEYGEIAGSSGWCAFDYNTHSDFGSGDYICYHGVMDMFRNPKLAAAVYRAQSESDVVGDVLEVSSAMNIGEYPGGARGDVYIITNAESVKLYVNGIFIKDYFPKGSPFKNLRHGPILIDDFIGHRLVDEDGIKEKHGKAVKSMLFALQKYGVDKLPFRYLIKGFFLWLRGVTDANHLRQLYGKYIGNWGGQVVSYRFEAIRGGKVVKQVSLGSAVRAEIALSTYRTSLVEDGTYDMSLVRISALDVNGNLLPYCQEAVELRTEGKIELVGPSAVSLKGGHAGCFIKSVGEAGEGKLIVKDWTGTETTLDFTVALS